MILKTIDKYQPGDLLFLGSQRSIFLFYINKNLSIYVFEDDNSNNYEINANNDKDLSLGTNIFRGLIDDAL